MKIGVVGGTGNISARVVRLLDAAGHDVVCINRGRGGAGADGPRTLVGDRNDEEWFVPAIRSERFDVAIDFFSFTEQHAAASLAAFRDVAHFIHISTVTAYGEDFDWLPVTEDHPLRPTMRYGVQKAEAERVLLRAALTDDFPVTIVRPSTTYGPDRVLRQIGIDTRWISRIREGRPIVKIGDGTAIHHLLHVDDAASGLAAMLGRSRCIGQTYNLVNPRHTSWEHYHATAMRVLGRDVEQIGVPIGALVSLDADRFAMAQSIFAHNLLFSSAKVQRDVPEFQPSVTMEQGLADAFEHLDRRGAVDAVERDGWEDRIIAAQQGVVRAALARA